MNILSVYLVFSSVNILDVFVFNNMSLFYFACLVDGPGVEAIPQVQLGCAHGQLVAHSLTEPLFLSPNLDKRI